ncbi:hypothetical protein ABW21_db0200249 [Orbilia brochopaga]|nr:hypothetical protein ABW21_db0200249 [Drechslerella brochopaga]
MLSTDDHSISYRLTSYRNLRLFHETSRLVQTLDLSIEAYNVQTTSLVLCSLYARHEYLQRYKSGNEADDLEGAKMKARGPCEPPETPHLTSHPIVFAPALKV